MTTTAYVLSGATRYHRTATCQALDTARLSTRGDITEVTVGTTDHAPCLLCVDTDRTEWTVTAANLGELWELIGPSKLHTSLNPATSRVEVDGLTVLEHDGLPRALARFGDTIRFGPNGRYTVHPAEAVRDRPQSSAVVRDTALEG